MGKRCLILDCLYLAVDGTCLLPESELKEKCPARERVGYEEKDEWLLEVTSRTLKVLQDS